MKRWISKRYNMDFTPIAERYQISDVLVELMVKRGVSNWEDIDRYLHTDLHMLRNPEGMKDFDRVTSILWKKIQEKKRILVIGDYDVDGIMSAYILYRGIELLGGEAGYRIPHRVKDGYGMRTYMAEEAEKAGYDTIITCDNGISAYDAVQRAKELGMTVLVTDHHEVPRQNNQEILPPADAVLDPKREACEYPFKQLCGAGIAYKIMKYLFKQAGRTDAEEELLPFAAIATVCDVVPLIDENRIIVKNGLLQLENVRNMGMKSLIAGQQFTKKLRASDLGFRIGPCINAVGRLEDAAFSLELLLEKEEKEAQSKAGKMIQLNEVRKNYTAKAVEQAVRQIELEHLVDDKVLVVYLEDCHESVAGIVAGRIREKYYRPTLILTKAKQGLKGSGRSIPEYHMQLEISKCDEILTEFGGHAMAAGFSLPEENLLLFRKMLNQNCTLTEEMLIEKVYFDREVSLRDMNHQIIQELQLLEPIGEGNPGALFAVRGVEVLSVKLYGEEKQLARIRLREGGRTYSAVDFQCELHLGEAIRMRYGEKAWQALKEGRGENYEIDMLYRPEESEMYGIQFVMVECR